MSMTRHVRLSGVVLAAVLCFSCGSSSDEVPPTGVDLDTPVESLAGWSALIASMDLPENRDVGLASWVETFREGLDIARMGATPTDREEAETAWWNEARRALPAIVGTDNVDRVIAWLEMLYGNRGTP